MKGQLIVACCRNRGGRFRFAVYPFAWSFRSLTCRLTTLLPWLPLGSLDNTLSIMTQIAMPILQMPSRHVRERRCARSRKYWTSLLYVCAFRLWLPVPQAAKIGLNVTFFPATDHAELGGYKIFVNPSQSEVLCTTVAEALAMGKFAIIAEHASNEFFYQFPNALKFKDQEEFNEQVGAV